MKRRSVLAGVAATATGCLSLGRRGVDIPTDDAPPMQAGPGDYPHEIRVANSHDRSVSIRLAVERADDTIYERTHDVAAGARETVAGFTRESFPQGRQYVVVRASTATMGTASAGLSVTACLGDVVISTADGESLELSYSIC